MRMIAHHSCTPVYMSYDLEESQCECVVCEEDLCFDFKGLMALGNDTVAERSVYLAVLHLRLLYLFSYYGSENSPWSG